MSKTIDTKVVEMRFDNRHFEKNVRTTMSTLDKLKQSLRFDGASKGLENVNSAANKVNMGGLGNAVETVHAKFSALEVMGVTALANITNSAVNAGKRIVSALTIDPVKTGFSEYETQINAVQTILANTQSKGTTIDDVNVALRTLNEYADKTIYNFTEMTRNIGTFTAAGIDLDTSVNAIQGIANLAAVSGSTSQQASTAMYQLSQALASGTVKLMDWNSVVNAGMGGQVFQDALKETARVHGIAIDSLIEKEGSFRETLSQGWLTSEILTETLQKFTLTTEGLTDAQIEANREMLRAKGYTEAQIDEIFKLGATATDAATKVKTFTQMWDVLKEAAQSGWSQTWQIIFGDFEQAKSLFTPLADFLTGIINSMSKARNDVLGSAFAKSFVDLGKKVSGFLDPIKDSADGIKSVVKSVEDYANVVDEILSGKWGDGQARWDKLTKAGYDWAHTQNLVNEKLGSGVKHATKYSEAQDKVAGSHEQLNQKTTVVLEQLLKLSDAELKARGYTEKQIKAFRELADVVDKTGIPLQEFIKNIDEIDGRWLFVKSFENAGKALIQVFTAMKDTWQDIFPPKSTEERADRVFNLVAGLHKLSRQLLMNKETVGKLERTFKGLFAALDIILTVVSGPIKIAFKIFLEILKAFDLDILDVTANIGDAIVEFRDWIKSITDFSDIIQKIPGYLSKIIDSIKKWGKGLKETDDIAEYIVKSFTDAFDEVEKIIGKEFGDIRSRISTEIDGIAEEFKSIPENIVAGFDGGLLSGLKGVLTTVWNFGKSVIEAFCNVFKIESPSKVMMTVGGFVISGLLIGMLNSIPEIKDVIRTIGKYIINGLENIDWGIVSATGWLISALFPKMGFMNLVGAAAGVIGLFKADLVSAATVAVDEVSKTTEDVVNNPIEIIVKGIGKLTKFLFGAITNFISSIVKAFTGADFVFSFDPIIEAFTKFKNFMMNFDYTKLLAIIPIGVVLALVKKIYDISNTLANGIDNFNDVIGGLADIEKSFSKVLKSFALSVKADALKKIAISIAILVGSLLAMTLLVDDPKKLYDVVGVIVILSIVLVALAWATDKISSTSVSFSKGVNIQGLKTGLATIGMALLMLAAVVAIIGKLKPEEAKQGFEGLVGIMTMLTLFMAACGLFINQDSMQHMNQLGKMMIKLAIALGLMVGVCKLVGKLSEDEVGNGLGFALIFMVFIGVLTSLVGSTGNGKAIEHLGGMVLKLSIAMLLMVGICKLVGKLTPDEMLKGAGFAAAFTLFIWGLNKAARIGKKKQIAKLGGLLLAISTSLLLMVAVCKLVNKLTLGEIVKGIIFVAAFLIFIKSVISITTIGSDQQIAKASGVILAMSVAIGILAGVSILLSLMPLDGLSKGVIAVMALSAMMALMLKASQGVKDIKGNLIVMAIAIAVMAASVASLSTLDTTGLATATASMTILMGMFSLMVKMAGTANKSIGVLAVLTIAMGMMGLILYKLAELPVESTIGAAASLAIVMISLIAFAAILGKAGPLITSAVGAMIPFGMFLGELALLIAACALIKQIPGVDWLMSEGGAFLEQLGTAIGQFIGGIAGGIAQGFTSSLPTIGKDLSKFMSELEGFISGAKGIKEDALTGIKNLGEMLLILTGATFIDFLSSKWTGGRTIADLGKQLVPFGEAMVEFSNTISGKIDESAITAVASAGKMIAEMQAAIPGTGGVLQWFTGERNFETFKTQIVSFGDAMVSFSEKVSGKIDESAVNAAVSAGKLIAELQSSIRPTGGVVQFFTGEKNLSKFGSQLAIFGEAIVGFSEKVKGKIDETAVTAAAEAGSIMTEFQAKLPGTGGVVQFFTGEKNLAKFGLELLTFGSAIVAFSEAVKGKIDEEAVTAAATAGSIMMELQSKIEPMDGVVQFFTGEKNLAKFGTQITSFGEAIAGFSETVKGKIDEEAVNSAVHAGKVMTEVQKAIPEDTWFDGKMSLATFGAHIAKFGKKIATFSENVTGIDSGSVDTAVRVANKLADLLKNIEGITEESANGFKTAINNLGKVSVKGFIEAFDVSLPDLTLIGHNMITAIMMGITSRKIQLVTSAKTITIDMLTTLKGVVSDFKDAGIAMINAISNGISSKSTLPIAALHLAMFNAYQALTSFYDSFYSAGSYLVDGFKAGISDNTYKAVAKARAMAKAAKEAAEEALGIASPSKVFYKIGEFSGMGLVNALGDYAKKSYIAGKELANSARNGLNDAIRKVADVINSDMDVQPTIRPVLDLSDVQNGVNGLNGLFGGQTLSLAGATVGNLKAVTSMAPHGGDAIRTDNKDIINAITNLRGDVGALAEAINNTQILMDGDTVVGTLIRRIDSNLGQIATYKGRGN